MSEWERDPEGETLQLLLTQVPHLQQIVEHSLAQLKTRAYSLFALSEISEPNVWTIAYAYNNLMALYTRGAVRKVAPERFLRESPLAPPAANAACAVHSATYLAAATQRQLIAWQNSWTLGHDRAHAYIPHNLLLRDIVRLFEAYIHFNKSLRLAEIVGASGDHVLIVDRTFANMAQYRRYVEAYDRALQRRQMAARRRLGCAECCPCVATAALSLYPRMDDFRLPYIWENSEKVLPLWFDKNRAIWTRKLHYRSLERIHNGVLWFFSGVADPLGVFFRVAESLLQPGDTDVGVAVGIVQEVATMAFLFYWDHPTTARTKQERFVLPALKAGRLYDPLSDCIINSCRWATYFARRRRSAVSRTPLRTRRATRMRP